MARSSPRVLAWARPRTPATRRGAPAAGARPPLVTRPLLVRFVSTVGAAASFYLLLSAVPEYARAAGASAGTAGLTTTALTLSSVAAYLVAPALIARYGYRVALAAGLGALGAPALLLAAPSDHRGQRRGHHGRLRRPRRRLRHHLRRGRRADRLADPAAAPRRGPGPGRGGQRRAVGGVPAAGDLASRARGLPAGVRGGRRGRAGRAGLGTLAATVRPGRGPVLRDPGRASATRP